MIILYDDLSRHGRSLRIVNVLYVSVKQIGPEYLNIMWSLTSRIPRIDSDIVCKIAWKLLRNYFFERFIQVNLNRNRHRRSSKPVRRLSDSYFHDRSPINIRALTDYERTTQSVIKTVEWFSRLLHCRNLLRLMTCSSSRSDNYGKDQSCDCRRK